MKAPTMIASCRMLGIAVGSRSSRSGLANTITAKVISASPRPRFAALRISAWVGGRNAVNGSPSATIGKSTPSASGIRSFRRTSRLGVSSRTSSETAASESETRTEIDRSEEHGAGILTELAAGLSVAQNTPG